MSKMKIGERGWWVIIGVLVISISLLHYLTPTMKWQYHLIFMQSYFIPILLGAFQFGIRGGLGTALVVSIFYFPHIMLQWGGLIEANLIRFLQIVLFNIIGYLTGLKAGQEKAEKNRYQLTARKLEASLEKVKEQTFKIEEMEDQLRQLDRLAVIGELAASLAHEVRNPLGSIRGAVDILKEEIPDAGAGQDFVKILIEETNRINQVVESYLGYAGKPRLQHHVFDVREIIQNCQLLLSRRAAKNSIIFKIKLPDQPLAVTGDDNQLQQVLVNLILNSLQALPQGGEILMEAFPCSRETPTPASGAGPGSGTVCIRLKDNGAGIPPEHIEQIFKPFFTTRQGGTGLGLAIVRRIVDNNKWELTVESERGMGTQFSILSPPAIEPEKRLG